MATCTQSSDPLVLEIDRYGCFAADADI